MRSILVFFSILISFQSGFSQDKPKVGEFQTPKVTFNVSGIEKGEIKADEAVPIGDTVQVTLSLPETKPGNISEDLLKKGKLTADISTMWEVKEFVVSGNKAKEVPKKFKLSDKDKTISFGTGVKATELQVECIITWSFVVIDEASAKFVAASTMTYKFKTVVTIGQMPNPPPGPKPPVNPEIPDGKLGLSKKVYELVNEATNKVDVANVLKAAAVKTLNEANAGKLKTDRELLSAWNLNNLKEAESFGDSIADSLDSFSNKLQPVLEKLYKDKKLSNLGTYKDLLQDFIEVMEKVK
jgi:hypothetical protein